MDFSETIAASGLSGPDIRLAFTGLVILQVKTAGPF